MYGLNGKVAIITGAGRSAGLGAAIAHRFACEGCRVVIADLGQTEGDLFPEHGVATTAEMAEVAESIRSETGADVLAVTCDVREEHQVASMVGQAAERFGGVDIIVNNAGVGYLMKPIVEMTALEWNTVLGVNLTGMFLTIKHAARLMIHQQRGGRVINIASKAAKSAIAHAGAYASSKHGVVGLTRVAAIELGPHNITVNAVCPNHVTTGLGAWQNDYFSELRGVSVDEYLANMRSKIPLGRTGFPHDTAAACAWLASAEAAYVTGDSINVSGGEEYH